jgi:hypothetical protein
VERSGGHRLRPDRRQPGGGQPVVCKPSEKTPLSTAEVIRLLNEELPAGVLQLALGDGALGAALAGHDGVDVVVHVGSVHSGRAVAAACAARGAKAVLEFGGKDPMIIDAGVDPAWAAEQAAVGCFANAGQICTSVERVYVHADVADAFVDGLVARAKAGEGEARLIGSEAIPPLLETSAEVNGFPWSSLARKSTAGSWASSATDATERSSTSTAWPCILTSSGGASPGVCSVSSTSGRGIADGSRSQPACSTSRHCACTSRSVRSREVTIREDGLCFG